MRTTGRVSRVLALLGCVAVVTTFFAYALVMQQQSAGLGEAPAGLFAGLAGAPAWFLAVLAATAAADGAAIWLPAGRPRRLLLSAAAALLAVVGFLAIFSVGLALLIAAALSAVAAAQDGGSRRPGHAAEGH